MHTKCTSEFYLLLCQDFLVKMCHKFLSFLVCHSVKVYYIKWNVLIIGIFHGPGEGLWQQAPTQGVGRLGQGKVLGNILDYEEENWTI